MHSYEYEHLGADVPDVAPVVRTTEECREWVGPEDRCGSDAVAVTLDFEQGICADHMEQMRMDPYGYHRDVVTF